MTPGAAARRIDELHAAGYMNAAARRRARRAVVDKADKARRRAQSLSSRLVRRLAVPATPTELAAIFRKSAHTMRSMLWQLKKQGRVRRLDRSIIGPRGYAEFLWQRVFPTKGQ